ncbi:UDP-N-acetylglucosamine 2-epimerase (hydrolyzing) [Microvenator marinus]|uniref:UDP-N-acetylglucosamine 2-epimerase (Hydrolyzing) n=1 Tax=Microvenator marinus TaxID=2600177 RepID=A0A5B8XUS9_9DELT|nr:UDP-N-acetylglucosamine 2-epimerase [Microvenator marinus]QED28698.1 UDP-N-acetylglucosamine 2-epimerase (hydrolyzing) [Microvenator marinus]
MTTILAVTVGRSDFGIYTPVFNAIQKSTRLELKVAISGMHMAPEYGYTAQEVLDSGLNVVALEDVLVSGQDSASVSKSIGHTTLAFASIFAREMPDLIMVLGDRFEMFGAATAAVPFQIPLVHLHGGEVTEGAMDEAFRHAITKMSHLHFTSTEGHSKRVVQLGEEPWRVHTVGAPALDHLRDFVPMTDEEFAKRFGFELPAEFLLCTFHPVTTELGTELEQVQNLLDALFEAGMPCVFTIANADMGGSAINKLLRAEAERNRGLTLTTNLGSKGYFTAMKRCSAMVGNTSSGIIEAASLGVPVLNVGNRQKGRARGANVFDVPTEFESIVDGVRTVLSDEFRGKAQEAPNPYGNGQASKRIVEILEDIDPKSLVPKKFQDLE